MKKFTLWNIVLLIGVLCFVGGAAMMVFGDLGTPEKYTLPALGLIFIGAGASGKRSTR